MCFRPGCTWKIPSSEVLGLGRNGQMDRYIWVHFDQTGPPRKLSKDGPIFSKLFPVGQTEPIHPVLDRNFRKFWLNGVAPSFTITGKKNIYRYTEVFFISRLVKSRFHREICEWLKIITSVI